MSNIEKKITEFIEKGKLEPWQLMFFYMFLDIAHRLEKLESIMNAKFDMIEKRFEMIDKRFEDMNKRFEDINK